MGLKVICLKPSKLFEIDFSKKNNQFFLFIIIMLHPWNERQASQTSYITYKSLIYDACSKRGTV